LDAKAFTLSRFSNARRDHRGTKRHPLKWRILTPRLGGMLCLADEQPIMMALPRNLLLQPPSASMCRMRDSQNVHNKQVKTWQEIRRIGEKG